MNRCPNCRSRVDPTFTTHCPECGQSLVAGVQSMDIPGAPRRRVRATLNFAGARRIIIALVILLWVFGSQVCSQIGRILDELPREALAGHGIL